MLAKFAEVKMRIVEKSNLRPKADFIVGMASDDGSHCTRNADGMLLEMTNDISSSS